MFAKLAERVTEELESNKKIKSEDRELYQYGIEQGIMILLNMITALVIGLIFHCLFYVVIFSAAFIPLRTYSGGFHAKTSLMCYVLSVLTLVVFCILIKVLCFPNILWIIISIMCSIIILVLSPVETENKPLDKMEVKVYRKRAHMIWAMEALVYMVSFSINLKVFWISIFFAWLAVFWMLVIGRMMNNKTEHAKFEEKLCEK